MEAWTNLNNLIPCKIHSHSIFPNKTNEKKKKRNSLPFSAPLRICRSFPPAVVCLRSLHNTPPHDNFQSPVAHPVMGDPTPTPSTPPAPPPAAALTLVQPSSKKKHKPAKVFRVFRNVFRSFPIITPACKLPTLPGGHLPDSKAAGGTRVTGTLFGYRKGRVSLSIQETSRCLPTAVVELAMQTQALQKEMSLGMVRIALECEKRVEKDKAELLTEPLWTMFCNGKKIGYGVKREANDEDLHVMEVLKAVSMGAGVLPGRGVEAEGPDGELAYMRAHFERVVGSKDSETFYMLSPDGNSGPELSIFFVRV